MLVLASLKCQLSIKYVSPKPKIKQFLMTLLYYKVNYISPKAKLGNNFEMKTRRTEQDKLKWTLQFTM